MLAHRFGLVGRATLVAFLLVIGVAHAAVGEQYLDPGWEFAAAPVAALSVEEEMVYLRAEIREAAHAKAQATLARREAALATEGNAFARGSESLTQRLVVWRLDGDCSLWPGTTVRPGGALVIAAAPLFCLNVYA